MHLDWAIYTKCKTHANCVRKFQQFKLISSASLHLQICCIHCHTDSKSCSKHLKSSDNICIRQVDSGPIISASTVKIGADNFQANRYFSIFPLASPMTRNCFTKFATMMNDQVQFILRTLLTWQIKVCDVSYVHECFMRAHNWFPF